MRDRKKRNITIISLCCLLVFMAVGYAVLSQALNINGTENLTGEWKVYIDSITEITEGNTTSGKSIAAEVTGEEKTDAYFEAELIKPGDYVEYKVIVKNEGNIDATLRELVTSSSYEHPDVKFNHTLEQGTVLKGGEEKAFTVKVDFLISATEIPEETVLDYTMRIVYEQFDGNTITTPPTLETDNSCFTVSADGVLEGYDYNCGLDVTVPASVNGINITSIGRDSFMQIEGQAEELGYGKYYVFRFTNLIEATVIQDYYVSEDEFSYNKELQSSNISTRSEVLLDTTSGYFHILGNLEDTVIYTGAYTIPLSSEGVEDYDAPEHLIYAYCVPEDFYVAEDQAGYEAMLKYAEASGIDSSSIYLDGDPDIPRSNYKVTYKDVVNSSTEDFEINGAFLRYTNGVGESFSLSDAFTSLDLSKAIYLESINTYMQFDKLERLMLPENGNLTTIGSFAFYNTKLTTVTIPSTVTSIGDSAFSLANSHSTSFEEIRINRKSSEGITFGRRWKPDATTVKYIG